MLRRSSALTEAESGWCGSIPATRRPAPRRALDAFLLPDSLQFAEYNAESPAGAGYSQRLCELFDDEPVMARFRERFDVALLPADRAAARRAARELPRVGRHARSPPPIAIVDWREVPTWSEFEILRDAFTALGRADASSAIRATSTFEDGALTRCEGRRIDLVYRRVLINDIVARADECARARRRLRRSARSAWRTRSAARFRTRRRSSPC